MSTFMIALLVVAGILVLFLVFFIGSAVSLWFQAIISNAHVGLLNIVFMRILHHFFGQLHIVIVRVMRAIDHD